MKAGSRWPLRVTLGHKSHQCFLVGLSLYLSRRTPAVDKLRQGLKTRKVRSALIQTLPKWWNLIVTIQTAVSRIRFSLSLDLRAISQSVSQSVQSLSRVRLCDPMNRSTPGLPVHHQLPELTQTHVHGVSDAIQPSHPLSSPFPPALNLFQHQGLFQRVSSWHQVAKVLAFQLPHQSFQ